MTKLEEIAKNTATSIFSDESAQSIYQNGFRTGAAMVQSGVIHQLENIIKLHKKDDYAGVKLGLEQLAWELELLTEDENFKLN